MERLTKELKLTKLLDGRPCGQTRWPAAIIHALCLRAHLSPGCKVVGSRVHSHSYYLLGFQQKHVKRMDFLKKSVE